MVLLISGMKRIGSKKPPRLFIREWIDHKRLDQKRIAERMDVQEGTVSKLLNGQMRMTMEWLSGFAEALDVEFMDLYRDPARPTQNELLSRLPPDKRRQAEDYIRYLASTGTDGDQ